MRSFAISQPPRIIYAIVVVGDVVGGSGVALVICCLPKIFDFITMFFGVIDAFFL